MKLFTRTVLILALFLALTIPVLAQGSPPVEDTSVPVVVVTQTPILSPVPTDTATPEPEQPPVVPVTGSGSVLLIIIAALAAVAGGGGIVAVIGRFRSDKAGMAALEGLGNSVPKETAAELIKVIQGLIAGLSVVTEAIDQVPVAEKPAEITLIPITELIAELQRRGWTAVQTPGNPG